MIFELVETQNEFPKFYVRIYERKSLESKIRSKNVYMYMKGEYVAVKEEDEKNDDDEMFAKQVKLKEVAEQIQTIEVMFGSRCNYVLSQFVKRILESYKAKYPSIVIN
jgi:hypothetical protein